MGWNDGSDSGHGGGDHGGGDPGGDPGGGTNPDLPVIERDPIHDQQKFNEFGCDVPALDPSTPDKRSPDVVIDRDVYMRGESLRMPDGKEVDIWGFHDPSSWGNKQFPSEMIRVRQGQLVHTRLDVRRVHTIHHHGIEPTTFNDGVGHTSFEVDGKYTYQWLASQAGTYFYHCHVNTALHFEMGMYGLLIVDPPEGPGRVFSGGPEYDVEAFWVADDIDPDWHNLSWDAGRDQCPFDQDVGLHNFNPKYFLITGAVHPNTLTDPRAVVNAEVGQRILIRVINASYTVAKFSIAGLDAQVVAVDGRPLVGPYAEPFTIAADTPFELTTAQRWDLIITPPTTGNFSARIDFQDWITGQVHGIAETSINVT